MQNPEWFSDFVDIIYPNACLGCEMPLVANEECICLYCRSELPKTDFHNHADNEILRIFSGRCLLQKATAYLYFSKGGIVQALMHAFKYKKRTEVGELLGRLAAEDLRQSGFFEGIDLIVPVPLHPKKLAKRGYNQSEILGSALAAQSNVPMVTGNLIRTSFSDTQTKKSRFARWLNVASIFKVTDPAPFENKHVLLVDDVVTTGSTVEAGVIQMESIPGIKISLFTLAMAK